MNEGDEGYGVKNIIDNWEFMTEFVLEPNLSAYGFDKDKFNHNNKTWITTNLTSNDAKTVRNISENIQILNRFNSHEEKIVYQVVHEDESKPMASYEADNEEMAENLLKEFVSHYNLEDHYKAGKVTLQKRSVKKIDNRFENLKSLFLDNLFGVMSSSAGRKASVMQLMRSLIQRQEQTIEDRTESKRGGFFNMGKG